MERINPHTVSNALTKPEPLTNENPKYENASSDERQNYQDQLYLLVVDSFRLSSQSPTDEELALRANSWTRVLMGHIPECDLQSAFDRAFVDHDSTFPLNAYELKDAYGRIIQDAKAQAARERITDAIAAAGRNSVERKECEHCFDGGFRYVNDPAGSGSRGVVRCNYCDYWWRRDQKRLESEPRKI